MWHGFLTWMQDPENREEVLALYYTAKDNDKQPSYYAFGPDIPIQSQYEIDLYCTAIGREHEAELLEAAEQRATHQTL